MSILIIPILLVLLFIYAITKKVNLYDAFVSGSKASLQLVFDIFPYVIAIFIMVQLFRESGLSFYLSEGLAPVFSVLGIPKELIELTLLRPFTGSGSLALLSEIYEMYGVDTFIGRAASVIMGSSETVFYVSAVYFSKTSVKKLGYAVPLALFVNLVGAILSCLLCRFI
ncbi:MAG: spore maturation protein [Tenericutes bacterium HGW-Tenericutes-4]|jgi:spore maturation protein B|nr:MAG: spore maturation protein [Tenericutes bacterium HGW-Tenericutes-4]